MDIKIQNLKKKMCIRDSTTSYIVNGLHRTPKPMDKSFDAVSYTHLDVYKRQL